MTEADAGVERGLHADDRGQRRVALLVYKYAAKVA